MKKSNKGFTLIETLVVSAFVIGSLLYLYVQINNAVINYDRTFRYDSIKNVYNVNTMYHFLSGKNILSTNDIVIVTNKSFTNDKHSSFFSNIAQSINAKTVLIVNQSNYSTWKNNINSYSIDYGLKQYLLKLEDVNESGYIIVIEFNDDTYASLRVGD